MKHTLKRTTRNKIIKHKRFGYYRVASMPKEAELQNYYQKKYYQNPNNKGNYLASYSQKEKRYLNAKISEFFYVLNNLLPKFKITDKTLLDVGSGEGWILNFFQRRGWQVQGLEYDNYV
jgi:2-polyprenyl-3-methyl-5-hydroxy-6-metoxy-1,4-benzoquinol methylase